MRGAKNLLLLAFETSAKAASVALFDGNTLLGEQYQNTGLTHSQTLMVMAENLLSQCGKTASQVEAVAVAEGPGSFTGVRIGMAAAKGFAWAAEIPIYGVSTLEAMALGLGAWDGVICPVMDARRSQVYNALFYVNQGKLGRQTDDRAISLEELKNALKNLSKPVFLVGDGSNLCYNTLSESIPNLVMPPEHRLHQRAVGVGLAALKRMAAGDPGDGGSLSPNYLRLSQAERERMERQARTGDS